MNFGDALRKVPIFADLDEATLRLVSEQSRLRRVEPGQLLVMEQDEGASLYVLLEGRVSVQRQTASGRTVVIALREPGDHFGEMSLLDGLGHSADVVALVESRVLVVSRHIFVQTVLDHPPVALAVMRALCRRLREQTNEVTRAKSLDLTGRVCAALLDLADESGYVRGVTQQRLAHQTGATRESINRTLQSLRDAGYVEPGKGFIRLVDRAALGRRAEEPIP